MLMLVMTQTVGHHVVTPGPLGQKEKGITDYQLILAKIWSNVFTRVSGGFL